MKSISIGLLSLAMIVLCVTSDIFAAKPITIKGSDTMLLLGQRWAEIYMEKNPGVVLQVTGGGSGVGIAALINGSTNICQSSRDIKDSERQKLRDRTFTTGVEIPVAKDGVTLYVNEKNSVSELTLNQIKGVYTGKITNWNQVGGPNSKIIVYGRENSSGTYIFLREKALNNEDYTSSMQSLPGTSAVVNAVARDVKGIGFGGAAYAKGVKELAIKTDTGSYIPTAETVKNGQYPLARNLYWYLPLKPSGDIAKLVDWVLSPEGQAIVSQVGYFTVK